MKHHLGIFGILLLSLLALAFYQLGMSDINKKQERLKEASFVAVLQEVHTGCYADGECYLVVDGKHLTVITGWSQDVTGEIIGVDSFGDFSEYLGQELEVYARQIDEENFSLYGSEDYFVRLIR